MRANRGKLAGFVVVLGLVTGTPSLAAGGLVKQDAVQAFAQAEKPPVSERAKVWTRARIAAAKKRWAVNREKFSGCNAELQQQQQLRQQQKQRRLSMHRQVDFLQSCMNRKP